MASKRPQQPAGIYNAADPLPPRHRTQQAQAPAPAAAPPEAGEQAGLGAGAAQAPPPVAENELTHEEMLRETFNRR